MDNFPLGHPRQHRSTSAAHFRMSPVNFPVRNSNSNLGNSQPQMFNPVYGNAIFGRAFGSGTWLDVSPVNHFNFPLRSNSVGGNNSAGLIGGRNGTTVKQIRGNVPFSQNHNTSNKSNRSNTSFKSNTISGSNSSNRAVPENNSTSQSTTKIKSTGPLPQYRIYKRGDSIPGIQSPGIASNNENGQIDNPSSSSESNTDNEIAEGLANNGGQNKENNSTEKDVPQKSIPNKTPIGQVTDIARFHGIHVEYRLTGEKGPPHNPTFTVSLHLGPNETYLGQGTSIKRAQNAAAIDAIENTSFSKPTQKSQAKRPFSQGGGIGNKRTNWALLQLTSLAEELRVPVSIAQQPITIMDPYRRGDPPSVVSVHVGERIFTGEGNNFNSAKNMAAMIALKAMMKVKRENELKKVAEGGSSGEEGGEIVDNKSPISQVHEMAMKRGLLVTFEVIKEEGPPHSKVFTVVCALGVDKTEDNTTGQGATKQAAKKAASELMMAKLSEMPIPSETLGQLGSLKAIQRGLFRLKTPRKKTSAPVVKDLEKQNVSPISRLIQIAHIKKYKEPEFTLVASSTNTLPEDPQVLKTMSERERRNVRKKKPSFTMEVAVGPRICCRGSGPNKKAAKKAAADAALIELGYGPTETKDEGVNNSATTGANEKSGKKNQKSKDSNVVSARQIVPGVLVLNNETKEVKGSPTKNSLAQEMVKVNSSASTSALDGSEKLSYLARLLNVTVSYSDFPKKNEFLSVVSLYNKDGTSPHVAHGCGSTLQEAQNVAATKIIEELSDMGLDEINSSDNVLAIASGNN